MKTILIESPYASKNKEERFVHLCYARLVMLNELRKGNSPLLSHMLYTQSLNDSDPKEREIGINAGLELGLRLDEQVFYVDFGLSSGMILGYNFMEDIKPQTFVHLFDSDSHKESFVQYCLDVYSDTEQTNSHWNIFHLHEILIDKFLNDGRPQEKQE